MNIDELRTHWFVGHDLNLNLTVQFSGGELQETLDRLTPLLRHEAVQIQDGRFAAPGGEMALSAGQTEDLCHYLVELGRADAGQRQTAYLIHLCLSSELARWSTHYVTLSGAYRIEPGFSEIRVLGQGPERRVERIALPDVRDALQRHTRMILLAMPGAGKSTVLQRLALDLARQRLSDARARLPLLASLADQLTHEDPHTFLARMWAQRLAARPEDAHADLAAALQAGHLCLLCDGVNEMSRDGQAEQLRRWQRFAGQLPAGNQIVFACRKDDYEGELAVAQVEIDPLSDAQVQDFACPSARAASQYRFRQYRCRQYRNHDRQPDRADHHRPARRRHRERRAVSQRAGNIAWLPFPPPRFGEILPQQVYCELSFLWVERCQYSSSLQQRWSCRGGHHHE